jgi:polyhydroxyalkanoate synthesis repressor PhaR
LLKKLQVLAGALRLGEFTVAELSEVCGASQNTVHTVLSRVPGDWLESTVVSEGARGGQRRRYNLSKVGISGVRKMLGQLPSPTSSILIEPTDEPVGLSAARASFGRMAQVSSSTALVLREHALRSLQWAEAEMRDGEFASDAPTLRTQIDTLRAQIEGFSAKDSGTPRGTEVSIAGSEEYLQAVRDPAPAERESDALVREPCRPLQRSGEPRTIKKYPNKRLYDSVESRYITLADIRRLVFERIDFVVVDKKSQEDITRSILLQVIAEQEHSGEGLMSRDFLSQVILSYGGAKQGMIGSYLEQSLKLFASQQRDGRERSKVVGDPAINHLAQKNWERWRQVQDEIYRTLMNAADRGRSDLREDDKFKGVGWTPAMQSKE